MTTASTYRRVVRRETHSSRSGIAIAVAVLLILAFVWFGTEAVLAALGQPALLVSPRDAVAGALAATSAPVGILTAAGAVVAVIGIVLLVVSLAPGRRGRRGGRVDRTAAVVDDRVIAQSVARTASEAGDVEADQVSVQVSQRTVTVEVTPTSGRSIDVRGIQEAVDDELASYDYSPSLRGRVRLAQKGTVGS